jgi:hypothetical protein
MRIFWLPCLLVAFLPGSICPIVFAGPEPGDVFREYRWANRDGDAGGSLRVGGQLDYGGGPITLPHEIDLQHAVRAEVVLEKLLCHDGTQGLAISVNDHEWIPVPEAVGIPKPQWDYQHHTYPVVAVPLQQLAAGTENQFRLRVSDQHPWNWPQHLIYGVHFRVYYDPVKKPHHAGRLISPSAGAQLGVQVDLQVQASSPQEPIARVDFLGCFDDVNFEGDGGYRQWHYHYVQADLAGHLGTADAPPWRVVWDTSWVPDQAEPLRLAAWITDRSGLTFFTPSVDGLTLVRDGLSVELCRPYDVPQRWVTRRDEHEQKFRIQGDLGSAVAAQLVWCSWSPGYMNGISINQRQVFQQEGPRYAYYAHRVPVDDLSVFQSGENRLKTGKTPKIKGKMVHGMEVNWPGIMVLIQYRR